jgi:hypothetical protein
MTGDFAALRTNAGRVSSVGERPRPISAYFRINCPRTAFNVIAMIRTVVGTHVI